MLTVLSIVGRSNVGKSTLFNRLTKSRKALVYDRPGVTRDRQFGQCFVGDLEFLLIDTAGMIFSTSNELEKKIDFQTFQAIHQSDFIIFLVDGREGLCPADMEIGKHLRRVSKKVLVVANKLEGLTNESYCTDFFELGFETVLPISSSHGDGVGDLLTAIKNKIFIEKNVFKSSDNSGASDSENDGSVSISIVGRPNVGKSTTINRLLGEDRVLTYDMPGTTVDSVRIPFSWNGEAYDLVDTAGIKKRTKINDVVERYAVLKTFENIKKSNVALFLVDGTQGVTDQDAHIASLILVSGAALVVGVNKWDLLDRQARLNLKKEIERKLNFLKWAKFHFFSALKGTGLNAIMGSLKNAYTASTKELTTNSLNIILRRSIDNHPPPIRKRFRPKLRYAHQGGKNPPTVVVHGTGLQNLGKDYIRYLEGAFREECKLTGTPLRIMLKNSSNPYVKKN